MPCGGVSLVNLQPILRVRFRIPDHQCIAMNLRQNRCCGNREHLAVALDDCLLRPGNVRDAAAAVQKYEWVVAPAEIQLPQSPTHADQRCLVYVDAVDFFRVHHGNGVAHEPMRAQLRGKFLALMRLQHLGVPEILEMAPTTGEKCRSKKRRADHDRPGQTAHANLVEPDDAPMSPGK